MTSFGSLSFQACPEITSVDFRTIMVTVAVILAIGVQAPAQTIRILYSFTGGTDGASPRGALMRDSSGNLYGTTEEGGAFDEGTVFKLDTAGNETVLHSFGASGDGFFPDCALVRDPAGNLYGTTPYGGVSGQGAVFKVDAGGNESIIHNFSGPPDGQAPYATLLRDAVGNLYGTTFFGGTLGEGSVFSVDPLGVETVLYSFGLTPDGNSPLYAGLIHDAAGNFYGATYVGGADNFGTIFKLSTTGQETILHTFSGHGDGVSPVSTLLLASGSFYGTTFGGYPTWSGSVFQVDPQGKFRTLYTFSGGVDGQYPNAGLVRDSAGNFYGTSEMGGRFGGGTVFKVSPTGKETVLHSFAITTTDGSAPYGALIRDAAGNLYGTTSIGGAFGYGTVYELTP